MSTADDVISAAPRIALPRVSAGLVGLIITLAIALPCLLTLPWSISRYNEQRLGDGMAYQPPSLSEPMGTDQLGRSMFWRAMLGGAISLSIGAAAATLAVGIGVLWGATAGYVGGRTDAAMMRIVDVLYGLPYILLVVLVNLAMRPVITTVCEFVLPATASAPVAEVLTLLMAIAAVSWLTMARVIRGQVLSLREMPFIEAAKACGVGPVRLFFRHLLPNLLSPIIVYTTLTVPTAILQESFLSFLSIGVQAPLPSWGNLAAEGLSQVHAVLSPYRPSRWWLMVFPCVLLGLTLLALNLLGDAMRARFDPRRVK
jgi:oligopeptide transport system permease protein